MSAFTQAHLDAAVRRLGMLKYFPTDPGTQAAVMEPLRDMCPSREALDWLIAQMVNRVGEWKGPTELRGVLCWKFPPADGVEASAKTPGYRPEDGEQQALDEHEQLKAGGTLAVDSAEFLRQIAAGKGL